MATPEVLYSKEGFLFKKIAKNNYELSFEIENKHILMTKILDFPLVKLMYDLNTDIYENIQLNILNDSEAIALILIKHLFEDLGMPQRYSYVNIQKIINETGVQFISKSIKNLRPDSLPENAELMALDIMTCDCNIINKHLIGFVCNVKFDDSMLVPVFAEKMIGLILNKVFKRVKQFIENVRI